MDRKKILISIAVFALLVGVIVLFMNLQQKGNLQIIKVPGDLDLYINDEKVSGGLADLTAGQKYHIVGKKNGWKTYDEYVLITKFDTNIIIKLEPDSQEAKQWLQDNINDVYDQIAAPTAQAELAKGLYQKELYPIINYLSYKDVNYTVTYSFSKPGDYDSFYVLIKSPGEYYTAGVQRIIKMGFDPGDYNIKFEGYQNPFEELSHDK